MNLYSLAGAQSARIIIRGSSQQPAVLAEPLSLVGRSIVIDLEAARTVCWCVNVYHGGRCTGSLAHAHPSRHRIIILIN